jgi:murein L,D-transpeptidase YafK
VEDRVAQYGVVARERLAPAFDAIGVAYPPDTLTFIGIKQDRVLEVWASDPPQFLKCYPILGASGHLGPKQKEGDLQVPEGLYRIESLNPNSAYHLSLRINYPNAFDKAMAEAEGRSNLGGAIMIHGNTGSVGCLAMGDQAAEDLFILAAETGIENISVILTPVDFRTTERPEQVADLPPWTDQLYATIKQGLTKYEQ